MENQTNSRLQATQNNSIKTAERHRQLWMQIVIIISIMIGLCLIFLLLIFPALVDFTGQINSQQYTPTQKQIRPQTPLFSAPPAFTRESNLKITGFGTPESHIQFTLNGEETSKYLVSIGINGEFNLTIDLKDGDNQLSAYSYDSQDLRSSETKTYHIVLDQETPEITLESPTNNQEIIGRDKSNLIVKGTTEPNIKLLINSTSGKSNSDGVFEIDYQLNEGENILKIIAIDQAENQSELETKVNFKP